MSAGGVSLSRKPAGARAQRAEDVVVGVEGRQDDDLGRVLARAQELGGGKAVHPRHPDVHQHDVRLMLGDCGGDLAPV